MNTRIRYGEVYQEIMGVNKELAGLRRSEQEIAQRIDLLSYQIKEIEAAKLSSNDEEDALRNERYETGERRGIGGISK